MNKRGKEVMENKKELLVEKFNEITEEYELKDRDIQEALSIYMKEFIERDKTKDDTIFKRLYTYNLYAKLLLANDEFDLGKINSKFYNASKKFNINTKLIDNKYSRTFYEYSRSVDDWDFPYSEEEKVEILTLGNIICHIIEDLEFYRDVFVIKHRWYSVKKIIEIIELIGLFEYILEVIESDSDNDIIPRYGTFIAQEWNIRDKQDKDEICYALMELNKYIRDCYKNFC